MINLNKFLVHFNANILKNKVEKFQKYVFNIFSVTSYLGYNQVTTFATVFDPLLKANTIFTYRISLSNHGGRRYISASSPIGDFRVAYMSKDDVLKLDVSQKFLLSSPVSKDNSTLFISDSSDLDKDFLYIFVIPHGSLSSLTLTMSNKHEIC